MIKFFRRIRQQLLSENKFSKYGVYAIGEIILVVIGILIALQVNNWNEAKRETREKEKLIFSLKIELEENQKELVQQVRYLKNCNTKLIKVLNFSASDTVYIQIDSLRSYAQGMIPLAAFELNTSRLNSAKFSGQFYLFDDELSALFTDYETALSNFEIARDKTNFLNNEDRNESFLHFSSLSVLEESINPNNKIILHPYYKKSDTDFTLYLKSHKTYAMLYKLNTNTTIELTWLEFLLSKTNTILNHIAAKNHDYNL